MAGATRRRYLGWSGRDSVPRSALGRVCLIMKLLKDALPNDQHLEHQVCGFSRNKLTEL
jgi:hypothetical protein